MISILVNVILPTIIMMRFSDDDHLGPVKGLLVALAFPFAYAVYDMIRSRKVGFLPAIGLVSLLISGGVGLLKLPAEWIAVKEAMVPFLLAMAILISGWMGKPLARSFLNQVLDHERVESALVERGTTEEWERRTGVATWMIAGTFFLSSVLNFILAKIVVTADGGSEEYTRQIGRMTGLSPFVISIPVFIAMFLAIMYVIRTVTNLTGLEPEQVLKNAKQVDEAPEKDIADEAEQVSR